MCTRYIGPDTATIERHWHEPGVAELIIGKQRDGPVGALKLTFLPLTRFDNVTAVSSGPDY